MTNLDSILKSRDIISPTNVCWVKGMVFPVVMHRCESWTIKKAKQQRIDAFELCWRRFLRVPWTARRYNQSILNIHWKDWCWSWNSNTLATWCEELTHLKSPWCWERLKTRVDRGWDCWMASSIWWTWVWVGIRSWWWTGKPGVLQPMGSQNVGHDWVTELKCKEDMPRQWILRVCVCVLSHVWLCDPMDCRLPGSSVHGISKARILECVAISFSRESSWPRDRTSDFCVFCIGRWILDHWVTWGAKWS